jgi:hypothetical protein
MDQPVLFRLVSSTTSLNSGPPDLALVGAVDSAIVTNVSLVEWHEVIPFQPFGSENNMSSYLLWTIPISTITVRLFASSLS